MAEKTKLTAAELLQQGYFQVSRKYRHVAQLTADDQQGPSLELDQETFDEFRRLGGQDWWQGRLQKRNTKEEKEATKKSNGPGLLTVLAVVKVPGALLFHSDDDLRRDVELALGAWPRLESPGGLAARVNFVAVHRGVTTAAYEAGADPTSWTGPKPLPQEGGDEAPRIFVANEDGTFLCADCIPPSLDLGDAEVEVWQEHSDGWTAPVVCRECKLSIPVYVDLRR